MGYAEDLVTISITRSTRTPSQAGFGTPLVAAYHTHYTDRVRSYSELGELVTDGFATTEPAYLIASAIFSQSPAPPTVKIGRRALAYTQVVRLTPEAPTAGKVYSVTINGTAVSYTAGAYDVLADVCAALAALITAQPLVTATGASGTYIDVTTDAAGTLASYAALTSTLSIEDRTTNPGLATDLNAIFAVDEDWYGLLLDSQGAAEITAAAVWTEANKKEFVWQSADSLGLSAVSTTDIFYTTDAAGYVRSGGIYYPAIGTNWIAAAWMGEEFPKDPGQSTWMWKTLAGITVYEITSTQRAALAGKNGNYYIEAAGVAITGPGESASGEWLDVVRDLDWLEARMRERVITVFLSNDKVPFTDKGISMLLAAVRAQLVDATTRTVLSEDTPFTLTAPRASAVSAANKALRRLPDVRWTATLAGAIHSIAITGLVSV